MATKHKLGTAELLFGCAQRMGLQPAWVTPYRPYGMFAFTFDGQERYINLARSPLNSEASASLAKDKYLTRRILERHNMQNIPFMLPHTQTEAAAFLSQYKKIIAKPIGGAGAHDIHIVTSQSQLEALKITDYILEKYISGKELRFLLLNGSVIGVHHSEYGTSVEEDRPLQRISYPKALWSSALVHSSLRIADILNLRFAAVDYLIDSFGQAYILEVNTMPGLKWFHAPSSGPAVDVSRLFLESILEDLPTGLPSTPEELVTYPTVAYS
jgi:glutathione synthase/RimK-type ligase-like ATP-grasp enzyme